MKPMSWGYQFTVRGKQVPGFNARTEKLAWPYKYSVGKRHCLVPAAGFYEWTGPKGDRTPHYITLKDGPMMFAGLWENREVKGEHKDCFTILTAGPNAFMEPIHNRMPLMLEEQSWNKWLDLDTEISDLELQDSANMQEHVVAPLRGDHAGLIEPK